MRINIWDISAAKSCYTNEVTESDSCFEESKIETMPVDSTIHLTPDGSFIHCIKKMRFLSVYRIHDTLMAGCRPQDSSRIMSGII